MENGKSEWIDWIKALLIALLIAFFVRTFLFSPIIVDGPSMLPTLHDRDQMFVNKFIYRFKDIERFDIVVFHATLEKDYIKRVIGLPGEHVKVEDGVLFIDGKPIEEPFLDEIKDSSWDYSLVDFSLEHIPGAYEKIPEDHYLVLGDNRIDSTDSRSIGLIHKDQIVGKTSLIYWPLKRIKWISR